MNESAPPNVWEIFTRKTRCEGGGAEASRRGTNGGGGNQAT